MFSSKLSEEFVDVSLVKMWLIDTKVTKITKFANFQIFNAFFVKVLTDFVDWNVLKGQQGKSGCPVVFYEEISAMFWMKMSQIDT